jgi:putative RNA 2'-phosphotransferase
MNNKEITSKSKFLSLILRHKPEEANLTLDENGWAYTKDIRLAAYLTPQELDEIVASNDKKRFEFNEDKTKIRACQGHSVKVDLDLKPVDPPAYLFHGTSGRFLESIKKDGLKAGKRNHVHLSEDRETARKVGSRHGGETVVLRIKSSEYKDDTGANFYKSTNNVWLVDEIPPEYIVFPIKIDMTATSRGFGRGEFVDRYDAKCSIQESSLADEAAIWLGCNNADPKILAFHINGGMPNGWVPYPVHPEAQFYTRMHLTVEMAEALIPLLQKFVKTGRLTE